MSFVELVTMVKYIFFLEMGILKSHYFQRRQIGYSVATTAMILMKNRYKQNSPPNLVILRALCYYWVNLPCWPAMTHFCELSGVWFQMHRHCLHISFDGRLFLCSDQAFKHKQNTCFMTNLRLRKQWFQFFFVLTLEFIRSVAQDNNWFSSVSSSNSVLQPHF